MSGDWHDHETRRLNKRSMRRAIVAIIVILIVGYFWLGFGR